VADSLAVKKGADGKRDIVSTAVLERAAWAWMRKSASAGLFHKNGAGGGQPIDGVCDIVESYVYRGPDWKTKAADGSDVLIKSGETWLMGALWTPRAWPLIKAMRSGGWSPEGRAARIKPSAATLAELRS
jgi:hypothetical protein